MDNNESPEVVVDALDPSHRKVLQVLAKKLKRDVIRVRPLERFGFSGAKLFEAFFTENKTGISFVIKVHEKKEIKAECKAFSSVKLFFDDCLIQQGLPPAYTTTHGAMAYKQFASGKPGKHNHITELKDLINDSSVSNAKLVRLVRQVYEDSCEKAHIAAKKETIVLYKEYRKYFRENGARPRIKQALGKQASEDKCTVLGTKIVNPLQVLKKGFRRKLVCAVGPIHGDLHTSNVVLDKKNQPHLIDFRWADIEGHILKDYVLLENSIRFMLFPQDISTDDQLKADKALLKEEGYKDIIAMIFSSPPATKSFHRLARLVAAVRVAAKEHISRNFNEYLAAQFLVLYGLVSYDSYNFFAALRTLGLIGGKLLNSEYMPKPRSG
jgi:hypothetical protein